MTRAPRSRLVGFVDVARVDLICVVIGICSPARQFQGVTPMSRLDFPKHFHSCFSVAFTVLTLAIASSTVALVAGLATTAGATQFSVNGDVFQEQGFQNTVHLGDYNKTLSVQAGGGFTYDSTTDVTGLTEHAQANSLADISGLHAQSFAGMNMSGSSSTFSDWTLGASDLAIGTYDDMVISGPAGTVTTSFNLFLHGSESASTTLPSIGTNNANENIQLSFSINGSNKGGGLQSLASSNGGAPLLNSSGMLVGWQQIGGLVTPTFTVQANVPFSLELALSTFAEVTGNLRGSFNVSGNADFGGTLTFAPSGSVFNLPQGYTANSAGAGIVNNLFVPEPSSFVLAALGFAGLAAWGWQRYCRPN
jgi:hypothetical protein